MTRHAPAVVVAGMHRSGTSLVASVVAAMGVDLGERQLAADLHNPRGYFEDLGFLDLQRRMLAAAAVGGIDGHPDWGWTEDERFDADALAGYAAAAAELVAARRARGVPWGWKDPRTSLLLDFWEPLLPEAVYVLVYRHPWAVAESMQQLGAEVFLRNPGYAHRIWRFYNRPLLDFYRRHRERAVLVSAEALRDRPEALAEVVAGKLGVGDPRATLAGLVDQDLLRRTAPDDPLVALLSLAHPEALGLLGELDTEADLPGTGTWSVVPRRPGHDAPTVSVVVPCHDHGELLLEALASVQRCVGEPWEAIVVDDGSGEPRTREILALLEGAGWTVIHQENRGLAAARNRGIAAARGRYLLPLDADNRLRPGYVSAAVAVLDSRPEVAVVYSDLVELGLRRGRVIVPDFELAKLLPCNFIDACALLRRTLWEQAGGFDASMPVAGWEDWDLWLSAAGLGWQLVHLQLDGFDYRVRPGSMISAFDDAEARARTMAHIAAKHADLYREHLVTLLLEAQRGAGELYREARAREAAERELQALRAAAADASGLRETEEELRSTRAELQKERETALLRAREWDAERAALHTETARLGAAIALLQERVGTME